MAKDTKSIMVLSGLCQKLHEGTCGKFFFSVYLLPFFIYTANPVLEKPQSASFIEPFLGVVVGLIVIIFLHYTIGKSTVRIMFPPGSYEVHHNDSWYRIDPHNDIVETTTEQYLQYSEREKKKNINLINKLGTEKIQKRIRMFIKILIVSVILLLFFMLFPEKYGDYGDIRLAGKVLSCIIGIVSFFLITDYRSAIEYFNDSYCKNCGKPLALEEFKAQVLKEESKKDTYTETLIGYWRCKNCRHRDIKIGYQYVSHRKIKCTPISKTCKQCGRPTLEEYRDTDVISDQYSETKRRYYKCSSCGYHEIRNEMKVYSE